MANKAAKKRRTIITYGVFAVVVAALVLYIALRRSDRMQYGLPDVNVPVENTIESITIERDGDGGIVLAKSGDSWMIEPEGFKADPTLVSAMTKAVSEFQITDLVSTSEYYDRYELDSARALKITAESSDEGQFTVLVGKRAPSYNHTYVRLDGDANIYHAATDLRRTFDKEREELRDKQVLVFAKNDVVRIGVATADSNFQVTKSTAEVSTSETSSAAGGWITSEGEEWAPEKVAEFLDRIYNLSCLSFIDGKSADLGSPQITVDIYTQQPYSLYLFEKDDTGYRARSTYTPFPFYLSEWLGDTIIETFTTEGIDDN